MLLKEASRDCCVAGKEVALLRLCMKMAVTRLPAAAAARPVSKVVLLLLEGMVGSVMGEGGCWRDGTVEARALRRRVAFGSIPPMTYYSIK